MKRPVDWLTHSGSGKKVILRIFHWNLKDLIFHFQCSENWCILDSINLKWGFFFFSFYMSVYHKTNEAHTHIVGGGKQAGAPCKLLLWIQCVFMTDDGQTAPDNNWHVYKWSLTGDAKPIRPICHIRSSQRGAHTHTRRHAHFEPCILTVCMYRF